MPADFYCWVQIDELPLDYLNETVVPNMLEKAKIQRVKPSDRNDSFIVGDFAKAYVKVSLNHPLPPFKLMKNAFGQLEGRVIQI